MSHEEPSPCLMSHESFFDALIGMAGFAASAAFAFSSAAVQTYGAQESKGYKDQD